MFETFALFYDEQDEEHDEEQDKEQDEEQSEWEGKVFMKTGWRQCYPLSSATYRVAD